MVLFQNCSFHRLSKGRPSPSINIGSATVSKRVLESYTALNIGTGVDDADTEAGQKVLLARYPNGELDVG